jgi:hypothetical protein
LFYSSGTILETIRLNKNPTPSKFIKIIFLLNLAWPDILSSIAFLIKITEDMANATRLYATLIEEKLNAKKFYETNDLTSFTQEVK